MRRRFILPLLVFLFAYTGLSKLFGLGYFIDAMHNQPLPHFISYALIWPLPALESGTALCLVFPSSNLETTLLDQPHPAPTDLFSLIPTNKVIHFITIKPTVMKKMKLHLLAIALCGASLAWINKPFKPAFIQHVYSFLNTSPDGSKYYYGRDLSASGYTKGNQYVCVAAIYTCSFYADPAQSHSDFTGNYFWVWDIPTVGIDNSGYYYEF